MAASTLAVALTGTLWATPEPPADETGPIDVETTTGAVAVATSEQLSVSLPNNRQTGLDPEILDPASVLPGITGTAVPSTDSQPLKFDPETMMRVEDLRPGMKGYGLTVFNGIRPEKFDVEVVGVRHAAMAGMDLVLCYLSSPKLKDIGVVAGMSGSPVYVDGKLIGAVAYGWQANKEALAGVTPIEKMLDVFNVTPGRQPEGAGADATFQAYESYMEMRRALAAGRMPDLTSLPGAALWGRALKATQSASMAEDSGLQPLSAPVFLSSSSPATVRLAQQLFPGMMITPVGAQAAAAGGSVGYVAPSLMAENSPGGAVTDLQELAREMSGGYGISVPFIEGDLSMAGVGTVTYRHGNRLVAFGHPMFEQGVTRFPMAPARINEVVRSILRPFKVGEPLGQVGLVVQDRLPAIGGVFGEGADMFPLHCVIDDPSYGGRREFNFRIWNDRDMSPMLNMVAIQEATAAAGRASGNTAILFRYSMAFDDGTSFTKEEYFSDTYGGTTAAFIVGADLGTMTTNPFKRVRPTRVDFAVRVADRLPEAQIIVGSVDQEVYRPGDTVTVEWEMQPYRKLRERRRFSFRLPENLADGTYELAVGDSKTRTSVDASRNPGGERIYDYEALVGLIRRHYPRNKVYVTLADQDTGVAVRGEELPKLPASIIGTFQDTVEPVHLAPVKGNLLVDADVVTPYDVKGSVKTTITVRRRI